MSIFNAVDLLRKQRLLAKWRAERIYAWQQPVDVPQDFDGQGLLRL